MTARTTSAPDGTRVQVCECGHGLLSGNPPTCGDCGAPALVWRTCARYEPPPLVAGGQGHAAEDVRACAGSAAVAWAILAIAACFAGLVYFATLPH